MDGRERTAAEMLIGELRDRLLRTYADEVRECLAALDDEQIWWRPSASCNSIGNLVLHLAGNLSHYLGRGVAGTGYRRDRPAEFAEQGPVPRAELQRRFEAALEAAAAAFAQATPERLLETANLGEESMPVGALLVAVTTHMNGHVGQIVYVTKMLREGVFRDELWRRVGDR